MNHNFSAVFDNIRIRPLCSGDIENLRQWRNNVEQSKFLRPIGYITPEIQKQWFENYLNKTTELCFAIEETCALKRMVGSVSLYDIENGVAEVGKIQIGDADAHGRGIGKKCLVMAMLIGFDKLGLKKIVGSVHQNNIAAHKIDMDIGFKIVGSHPSVVGGFEDNIEIDRETLVSVNSYAKDIMLE